MVSVFAVSGEVDILLEVIAEDMQHFSDVVLKNIFDTEGVNATRSSFVLEEVKSLY
ncbi:MAG: Lrp/AsnC ligand binding domain-containing protein [Spirochaetales bacterium]|nr:Lrp/AsnC ligand binding domain-containing protein [Spirochaetales bacterium]